MQVLLLGGLYIPIDIQGSLERRDLAPDGFLVLFRRPHLPTYMQGTHGMASRFVVLKENPGTWRRGNKVFSYPGNGVCEGSISNQSHYF